jgi:dTMP kinase
MRFITFEGIEGSGKSTQAQRLSQALAPVALLTQEPGGTTIGRAIREVLLDHRRYEGLTREAELLLYFADRAQHVAEVMRPALDAGRIVISDRYTDSSLAYQGYGREIPLALIEAVAHVATGGLAPELTIFLDVPVETGLARVGKRGPQDRLESEVQAFHERVRAGYLELIARDSKRWLCIDGTGSSDEVEKRVLQGVESRGLQVAPRQHGLR